MNKKGGWEWEQLGKIILAIILLVIVLLAIFVFRDKLMLFLDKFKSLFGLPI